MTIKLYDENSYLKTTSAVVTACCEWSDKKFAISLDQTPFYPEGGGQPGDQGTLSFLQQSDCTTRTLMIEDTLINTTDIWHVIVEPIEIGTVVQVTLNWSRRFYHMQQHLGQHLLSASFYSLYNAKTIGFHMGTDYVTIDLDLKLEHSQIRHAETLANEQITLNIPVVSSYPDSMTLANLSLRKIPKVDENIRIVSIDEFDHTPCGGTHPSNTGEVGMVSIRKWSGYKGGTRIEFICGGAALKEIQQRTDLVNQLCQSLSVQEPVLSERVSKLLLEIDSLKRIVREKTETCLLFESRDIVNHPEKSNNFLSQCKADPCNHILYSGIFDAADSNALKSLSQQIQSQSPTAVCLLIRELDNGFNLLLDIPEGLASFSAKNILKDLQNQYNGKGGGSDRSAQSTFQSIDSLPEVVQSIVKALNVTVN